MRRKIVLVAMTILLSAAIAFVIGEVLLRLVAPRASMYPRREFSAHYGFEHYKSTPIVHETPGQWRFTYTVNDYGYRGKAVPIANAYATTNVVVLGDSYSFGVGVNDGEEYSAVLKQHLGDNFEVINLGIGGWGLTQEIRRFYEFGQVFQPQLVILQFTSNDLQDNLINRVTTVEQGQFRFHNSASGINWVKRYLSSSIIQKSQIYNLVRNSAYRWFESGIIEAATRKLDANRPATAKREISPEDKFYIDLLEAFASDLNRRGIHLMVIDAKKNLDDALDIRDKVFQLNSDGKLLYVDVGKWLKNESDYESPEGHAWGAKAHRIIGTRLADVVARVLAQP